MNVLLLLLHHRLLLLLLTGRRFGGCGRTPELRFGGQSFHFHLRLAKLLPTSVRSSLFLAAADILDKLLVSPASSRPRAPPFLANRIRWSRPLDRLPGHLHWSGLGLGRAPEFLLRSNGKYARRCRLDNRRETSTRIVQDTVTTWMTVHANKRCLLVLNA